jgi:hypothetical protein
MVVSRQRRRALTLGTDGVFTTTASLGVDGVVVPFIGVTWGTEAFLSAIDGSGLTWDDSRDKASHPCRVETDVQRWLVEDMASALH